MTLALSKLTLSSKFLFNDDDLLLQPSSIQVENDSRYLQRRICFIAKFDFVGIQIRTSQFLIIQPCLKLLDSALIVEPFLLFLLFANMQFAFYYKVQKLAAVKNHHKFRTSLH